eukprot:2899708-Lingulodinium_polyedra.AAC.1
MDGLPRRGNRRVARIRPLLREEQVVDARAETAGRMPRGTRALASGGELRSPEMEGLDRLGAL